MSDNIYKVLMGDNAPFGGMANVSYLSRLVKGYIVRVHYDLMEKATDNNGKEQYVLNQQHYRTVDVRWLEGKPHVSANVHIPELVSYKGYGLNYLPSVGDIVMAAYNTTNEPVIISIIARSSAHEHGALDPKTQLPILNSYGDPEYDTSIEDKLRPTPIRYIEEGEQSLTSLNSNSELYFDKYGTAKLISRIPNLNKENGQKIGDRLWEISIGQDVYNEGTKELKKSSFGNNVQFQVLGHQNDCKVDFDSEGNIEINNKGNTMKMSIDGDFIVTTSTGNSISLTDGVIKVSDSNGNSITMNNSGIQLGDNANFSAVLGESLNTLLESMITIFNSHTHIYSPGGGTPTSTATTLTPMTPSDILSKTIKLKQ